MFVVKNKDLGINWEFKWVYRTTLGEKPDTFVTRVYVKFLDRDTRLAGILGAVSVGGTINKDECRLAVLYQALHNLCDCGSAIYYEVLKRYAEVHSVPKHNTVLGANQERLVDDLQKVQLM